MRLHPAIVKTDLAADVWDLARRLTGGHLALLESGGPVCDGLSRWSVLASAPSERAWIRADQLWHQVGDGAVRSVAGPPAAALARLLTRDRAETLPATLPFVGGWIGYLAYEFVRHLERVPTKANDHGLPDAYWARYDCAYVIDRQQRTVWAVALGANPALAQRRLTRWLASLQKTARALGPAQRTGPAQTALGPVGFAQAVQQALAAVHDGEIYQANLSHRFEAPFVGDPLTLYGRLRAANPSPFMVCLDAGDHQILSSSPERLLAVHGDMAATRPIAGTRRRSADPHEDRALEAQLLADPKERAEHVMLVDLERNDLSRVCIPGSVHVSELFTVERYSHVMHLVSNVCGQLQPGTDLKKLWWAMFPGGTVTGAPKLRAIEIIEAQEPVARGPYTGSAGYLSVDGSLDLNILIRTLVKLPATVLAQAGSGIVRDSQTTREYAETVEKVAALLDAVHDRETGQAPQPPHVREPWFPPRPASRLKGIHLVVLDNYDSFTYNLVQYAATLGATVMVVRNDEKTPADLFALQPTHLLVSPGPGAPDRAGVTLDVLREAARRGLPTLGVCLGHQALGQLYGGIVRVAPEQVHGKTSLVYHQGGGLLHGLKNPLCVTRYHSLFVDGLQDAADLVIDGRTADGLPMALHHRKLPLYGVQFHPESILTEQGLDLLENFLRVSGQS